MKINFATPFLQVIGIGVLTGMRATVANAITSQILCMHPTKAFGKSKLKFMQAPMARNIFTAMVAGELVMDKMPFTTDRINAVGVIGRCVSGAMAGASMYKAKKEPAVQGALLGAAAAFAGTYASFYLRKAIVKATGIYDPIIGAVEDAVVIGAGIALISTRVNTLP